MSGAPSTVSEATDPANIAASKPRSAAMRPAIGSCTEAGWMQAPPARIARKAARRCAVLGGRSIPGSSDVTGRTVQPAAVAV